MEYYCVLWMPTAFHQKLSCRVLYNEKEVDISDIKHCPHKVKISLSIESQDIVISPIGDHEPEPITLKFIESSSNGLFLYKYEIKDDKNALIGKQIPYAVYHAVKEFYHKHEHHDPEEDAYLTPFCSERAPKIKECDNEALKHYLKNYAEKFSAYLSQIKSAYDALNAKTSSPKLTFNISTKANKEIIRLCTKVRGEELYYNSLNKSKYNTVCKTGNSIDSEFSKIAFNIENTLESIKLIELKILHDYSFLTTKLSIEIAWFALIVGFVLGVVSIILSVIP